LAEDRDPKSLRKGQKGSMLRATQTKTSWQPVAAVRDLEHQLDAALQHLPTEGGLFAGR
jgi:hypothetical protein